MTALTTTATMSGLIDRSDVSFSSPSCADTPSPVHTPDTRQTWLSLETSQVLCSSDSTRSSFASLQTQLRPLASLTASTAHNVHPLDETDPFTSSFVSNVCSDRSELSATADSFCPRSLPHLQKRTSPHERQEAAHIENKNKCFFPDFSTEVRNNLLAKTAPPQEEEPSNRPGFSERSTSTQTSCSIMMASMRPVDRAFVRSLLEDLRLPFIPVAVDDRFTHLGLLILHYSEPGSAERTLAVVHSSALNWKAGPLADKHGDNSKADMVASAFDAHVTVSLSSSTTATALFGDSSGADRRIRDLYLAMSWAGHVKTMQPKLVSPNLIVLDIEYYSELAAAIARSEGYPWAPEGTRLDTESGVSSINFESNEMNHKSEAVRARRSQSMQSKRSNLSLPVLQQLCYREGLNPLVSQNLGHTTVDVSRIRDGQDVRTTIMLRNIPNKVDQPMLKKIVDETSFGKYDFLYLRIDFANNCNVGYAFINFEDSLSIIDFVNAVAGKKWNRFNSDKIAEVSYATIQGRDCLVQKFRNSSVMLEAPLFRPKIFRTGQGPLSGMEEAFPPPDNQSKMRRSLENAEHVGLFAPRMYQLPRSQLRSHLQSEPCDIRM